MDIDKELKKAEAVALLQEITKALESNAAKTINAIIQVVRVDFSYGKFKVAGIIKTFK